MLSWEELPSLRLSLSLSLSLVLRGSLLMSEGTPDMDAMFAWCPGGVWSLSEADAGVSNKLIYVDLHALSKHN